MITPNLAMYMRPRDVAPSAWLGHIPFAGWITQALRPRTLVELGTHHGTSFLAFCQAIQEQAVDCRAFAVDTWQGDSHAGSYGAEVFDRISSLQAAKYGSFSKLLRMTFDEAQGCFENGSIDLLHIDGLHTYEAVKHDFETWLPKLSDRAIVLLHDISERERKFGVWKFWEEITAKYPSHAFTHSHGLGVVAVGEQIPEALRSFFEMDEADKHLANLVFERAASHIEIEADISRLQSALQHERALRRESDRLDLANMNAALRGDLAHIASVLAARFGEMRQASEALEEALIKPVSTLLSDVASLPLVREDIRKVSEEDRGRHSDLMARLQDHLYAAQEASNEKMASILLQNENLSKQIECLQQEMMKIADRRWWHAFVKPSKD